MQFSTHSGFLSLLVFPAALFVAFRYGPVGVCWVCSLMLSLAALRIQPDIAGVSASSLKSAAELQWEQVFVATVFLTSLPTAGIVASLSRTRLLLARRTDIARIARRRADQAVRVKTEFLANMSHEIRTPLNGVIGLADALSRTSLDGAQREMLDMILSSGRTLNELVSDALDLARAESGALTLASEPFDVREVVGGACYPFAILAETNGIAFHTKFDLPDKVAAIGDALRIRQIVSNLVSNAVKFTSQGSVDVRISLRPQGRDLGRLSVSVKDTGPGFDAEVKARLFQRFEQADGSVVQKFGGTGLGLAIVRRLADMMQGDVRCEAAPGKGAQFTFEVVLPLCGAVAADEPIAPVASFSAADAAKPRVLVAEDHPINQKVIQALLGEHFDLTIVGDGQAAVDAYAAHPFDVILMDTQMPVMDGLSAIRAIRAGEADRGGRIPIVSLTAGALPTQIQEALEAGADLHMAKPVTANGLLQMMAEVLSLESA